MKPAVVVVPATCVERSRLGLFSSRALVPHPLGGAASRSSDDSSGALRGGVRSGLARLSPQRGPTMWLLHLLLTLTIAVLLTSIPCTGYAGGPAGAGGMGHAGGFRVPGTISASPLLGVSSPFRVPFGSFVRSSLWGSSVVWVATPQVVVVPVFVQQQVQIPSEAPVPDPQFVFPVPTPTPSASSTSGLHTVIVQRGSKIEVQSFLIGR
jgi:hypothetical protein